MLVNKYHYLDENYTPEDIKKFLNLCLRRKLIDSVVYNALKN